METHKQERAGYYTKMDALKEEMQENLCPAEYSQDESFPGAEPPEDHYGAEIRPSS